MNEHTKILELLGFSLQNGANDVYHRTINGYVISCDLANNKINYGTSIICHRKTTSNFSQSENLVILECIIRLLEKGYHPKNIELEKSWNLGHKGKGFLDILVKDQQDNTLFMIECKTWGDEFNKEKNKTFKDGGQLLSYFRQDKRAKALCLYASTIKNNKIHFTNEIIDTNELHGENEIEIFDSWRKSFLPKGIFESHVHLYQFKTIGLTYSDLEDLERSDGKTIFNQFAEILRRHVVSDKTNAFNKIFNLFICKIKDEDQKYNRLDEELLFQYKVGETYEGLIDKLKQLYKEGLQDYIQIIVPYISREELQNSTLSDAKIDEILYYRESQEFSFKDVYNKETFEDNTEIVKEVVELLQKYKIKYAGKQQHLGDFFELLLNTGIKQESGQFFTPIPLARFICKSLPIESIIKTKNDNKEIHFLPYVIDYASGSGHFITEMMDEIDGYVNAIKESDIKGGRKAVEEFNRNKNYIAWAKQYIYAIEKDYRLVKISKIASFLNGDGDANVMSGDGLAPFINDKYQGVLRTREDRKENDVFDVIVANPPYSVSGFKKSSFKEYDKLRLNPNQYFELYNNLTDQSSEIECLFIERAKQILKTGGVAGIILPVSILTNGGIYEKTREIIFKNFMIKGILSLGSNAFMATNTRTIILFMQKRSINDYASIESEVNKFFTSGLMDVAVGNIHNAFSSYVKHVYEGLTFDNYCNFLNGVIVEHEIVREYSNLNISEIKEIEKQKVIYFILTFTQKIIFANSGEKEIEKEFYGFDFSNRRGHEGINIYKDDGGCLLSKLYNENDLLDKSKLNRYILKSFENYDNLDKEVRDIQDSESHPLKGHIFHLRLSDLMTFDVNIFDKSINLNKSTNFKIETKWGLESLQNIVNSPILSGNSAPQDHAYFKGEQTYPFIRAGNLNFIDSFGLIIPDRKSYVNHSAINDLKLELFDDGCILFPKSGRSISTNNIGILREKSYVVNHLAILKIDNPITRKYVFYFLKSIGISRIAKNQSDYLTMNIDEINNFKIPLPSLNVQEDIINEIMILETAQENAKKLIVKNEKRIHDICNVNTRKEKISRLSKMIKRGKSAKYGKSSIQIIKSGQVRGLFNFDFTRKHYVEEGFILDDRKLEYGDILINSTGVGTAGRVNIFTLNSESSYVVDSHITIVRLNQNMALPEYVLYQLWHFGFANIEKLANGQSGQIELSPDAISNIYIPIPPLIEEQQIIVDQIMQLRKEIDNANLILSNSSYQIDNILDNYLK